MTILINFLIIADDCRGPAAPGDEGARFIRQATPAPPSVDPQMRISQKSLEEESTHLKRLQSLGLEYLQAAELGLVFIKNRFPDPVLASATGGFQTCFLLAHQSDNLRFTKPAALHWLAGLQAMEAISGQRGNG